jgi:DNA-directed RNA polymerase subunit RPC12/RpoP
MELRCSSCKEHKAPELFYKNKSTKTGYSNQCQECRKLWKPSLEQRERYNERTRNWNRKKLSGFTVEDYETRLAEQDYRCAICETDNPGATNWHTDHNHDTGQKRGILCHKCNTGLGLLKDSTEVLEKAIMYLNKYNSMNNEVKP